MERAVRDHHGNVHQTRWQRRDLKTHRRATAALRFFRTWTCDLQSAAGGRSLHLSTERVGEHLLQVYEVQQFEISIQRLCAGGGNGLLPPIDFWMRNIDAYF